MSFLEIFQPGIRHLHEEKVRRTMLVSRPTHGGGAPLGIDLEAGVATIKIAAPRTPADDADAPASPADDATEGDQAVPDEAEPGGRPGS